MTTIRFSAATTTSAATTISVALGGTPSVGDLVVVFLSTDNEIITHQPGYNTANQWHQLQSYRCKQSTGDTLSAWHHTWNASDSGSSVTFTFVPANANINVGEKVIPSTNAMAVGIVLAGQVQYLETSPLGTFEPEKALTLPNRHFAADLLLYAAYSPNTSVFAPDTLVASTSNGNEILAVWSKASPTATYQPGLTTSLQTDLATVQVSLRDGTSNVLYVAPYLEEGPMADNRLMFRFKLLRHFTVLNTAGTFTAVRYQSTDQINAATQVFTNDSSISSTDRTNILNAGIGGEFRATA